eukprot:g6432.t1
MDVSVLTAYKSELRRVATILKDKDHVKKRKRAEPEEEQPQKFYLVATFRWVRHWRVLARQHSVINVPRFRPGYHKVVIFFWIDVADDTDEDEAPQQVEPAAPPAPPAPSPPATCAHLCSGEDIKCNFTINCKTKY